MEREERKNEIRDFAVIVAGITGLQTGQGEGIPASFAESVRRSYDAIAAVVRLYGGMMNPFTGEQMTAYFGPLDPGGRIPALAVNVALEIRSRIDGMVTEQELPEGAGFRAAIASGEAILMVTETGKARQTALAGSPVELSIHLRDFADPGQILVNPGIYQATHHLFDYHTLDPLPLAGQKKPVQIYELNGKKKENHTAPAESVRMIGSDMVGRGAETRSVEELIKQLLNGRGGVLNIEGAAGIGKSRLISEVKALEIAGNVIFLEGRALSEGKNLSFHPIIHLIKSWSGITDEDNPASAYQKLSQNIITVSPEQAAEILPFVATMMGYVLQGPAKQRVKGIEGEALEKLILKNVRDLLARAAEIKPLIFLIEDAHWCDQSSISFLESLFKLAKNHRILFINIFRPGNKETGEQLKFSVRENLPDHYREIVLNALDEAESGELINNLMNRAGLPEDIVRLIISRSEGNPFFIEEVIRSFIDEGLVEIKENRFIVTARIQYANIPESIDKVILSRIERLDEKTRSLLKTASVIGRNFYYKVLEEATQTIKELDSRLEYLTETQLLNERRHQEDVEFLFKHALAQQATYDSILQKTRKDLHLKIAHSIEKVFADKLQEFYGVLAMHYGKAEAGEKQLEYLVKAGDEAFRSGASNEALNFYLEAFNSLPPNPNNEDEYAKYKDLEIKVGFAQEAAGNNVEAIESFQRIITKYYGYQFPTGELRLKIRALYSIASIFIKLNLQSLFFRKAPDEEFNTFMRVVTQWGEAMTSLNPRQLFFQLIHFVNLLANYDLSRSLIGLSIFLEGGASMFMWTGISFKISKKMMDYGKKAGVEKHPSALIDYRFIRKMHDFHTGNLEEDRDLEDIFRTAMHIGDFWPATILCVYCGMVSTELGKYERVSNLIHKLEEISESFDNSHARAQSFRLSAWAHYKFRKIDQTLEVADDGIRITGRTGHFAMLLVIWCAKSLAHSARNEPEEAAKALAEASKLVAERKIITIYHVPYVMAKAAIELAELRTGQRAGKAGKDQVSQTLQTIDELIRLSRKMRSASVEAYRLKALAYCLIGKQKKAFQYFTLSIRAGHQYNAVLELSRTYFEAGKCLLDPRSKKSSLLGLSGSEYLLKARALFEEMDLQFDLREFEQYMEG